MKSGFLIGLIALTNPAMASEMPEDLEAYLKSKGEDREERSLEEWLALYGEEMPPSLPAPPEESADHVIHTEPNPQPSPQPSPQPQPPPQPPPQPEPQQPPPQPPPQPEPQQPPPQAVPQPPQPVEPQPTPPLPELPPQPSEEADILARVEIKPPPQPEEPEFPPHPSESDDIASRIDELPPPQPEEPEFPPHPSESDDIAARIDELPPPQPEEPVPDTAQPFALTLVNTLPSGPTEYTAYGCGSEEAIPLLDNGEPPDTRPDDEEYTAFLPACHIGPTPIAIWSGDSVLWKEKIEPPAHEEATSLRLILGPDGISLDDGTPTVPPPQPEEALTHQEPLPDPDSLLLVEEPEDNSNERSSGAFLWAGIVLGFGALLGIGLLPRLRNSHTQAIRSIESKERELTKITNQQEPRVRPLGKQLKEGWKHALSLGVIRAADRRSLSLSIAKTACENGTVLLVAQPQNRDFYTLALSKKDPVLWFKGEVPTSRSILKAIEENQDHLALVILEGPESIRGFSFLSRIRMQRLVEKSPIPVTTIMALQEGEALGHEQTCSVIDGIWNLDLEGS